MATEKKKFISFTSSVGTVQYPKLLVPHKWDEAAQKSLPNPDGDLSANLVTTRKDAQPLIDLLKQAITDFGSKPKYDSYSDELDKENENKPTGNVVFKFKAYGKKKDGTKNSIKFFDSAGKPVNGVLAIGPGSKVRFLGYISVAKMGTRLNIRECQIIDLVERADSGFDAYEGGTFTADDQPSDQNETSASFAAEKTAVTGEPEF